MPNWTVADESGDNVARHYPFDGQGYDSAASHAALHGYCLWQSFDGQPRYLVWRPRRVD